MKASDPTPPVILVQHIHTYWTKHSRGAPGAVKRNAVPEGARVSLPPATPREFSWIHHTLSFEERHDFEHPRERLIVEAATAPIQVGCVTIDGRPDRLHVVFQYDTQCGGAPERWFHPRLFALGPGEWIRVRYNGRFIAEGWWWYEKNVVNAGLFTSLSPDAFMGVSRPTDTRRWRISGEADRCLPSDNFGNRGLSARMPRLDREPRQG